jgi:signal transduction histidine kinase
MLREGFIAAFAAAADRGRHRGLVAGAGAAAAAARRRKNRTARPRRCTARSNRTAHRRAAAEGQAAQADAANQAKSRYITTISHELRTPLNSILGYAQLLEDDEAMPAHRRQAVSVIRRGGDHLLRLIEGTLDIARIESAS